MLGKNIAAIRKVHYNRYTNIHLIQSPADCRDAQKIQEIQE